MRKLQRLSTELYRANDFETEIHRYCVVLSAIKSKRIKVYTEEVYETQEEALRRGKEMIGEGFKAGGATIANEYASVHFIIDALNIREKELSKSYLYFRM